MDIIKWRQSYETGIGSMDVQHQKLIELINNLYKVIRDNKPDDSIKRVLNEMKDYAENHLQAEESILENNGYPELSSHVDLHRVYQEKVNALIAESKNENEEIVKDTYAFLRQWWMEHIVTEDKKYGEFLKTKGVK